MRSNRLKLVKHEQPPDTGTPERSKQQGGIVIEPLRLSSTREKAKAVLARAICESVLDRYYLRECIDDRQYEAGRRFATLYRRAAICTPATTSSYGERRGGGSGGDLGIDARKRMRRLLLECSLAVKVTAEPIYRTSDGMWMSPTSDAGMKLTPAGGTLVDVCAFEKWAGGTRAIKRLQNALTALADHWRIGR